MNFWIVMNFLQKKVLQNEEAQKAVEELAAAIETNQNLQLEQQASIDEKYRLEMELQAQLSIVNMLEEERNQRDIMAEELTAAHRSSMELQQQLRHIDLKNLGYYEMLVNEIRRQQEWKEMEEVIRQRQELRQQMENRHIVQQLRSKQNELEVALSRAKEGKEFVARSYSEATRKLEAANDQRNRLTLSMVEGSKKLEHLRNEINSISNQKRDLHRLQDRRSELRARLEKLRNLQKHPKPDSISTQHSSADEIIFKRPQTPQNTLQINNYNNNSNWRNLITPPAIDPFNPMAFLKTLDIKFEIGSAICLPNISPGVVQQETKKKLENSTFAQSIELRPILRGSDSAAGSNKQEQKDKIRHVHFAEPDNSSNCTSPPCPSPVTSLDADENMCLGKVANELGKNTKSLINYDSSEAKERQVKEEVINALTRETQDSAKQSLPGSCSLPGEWKEQPEPKVDILECRLVKPAGSVLPTTLTNTITLDSTSTFDISSVSDYEEKVAIPAPILTAPPIFKTPNDVTKSTATAIRKALDDFLKKPSAETNSISNTSLNSKSSFNQLTKKIQPKKILDFDSMFMANTSSQSEDDELNIEPTSKLTEKVRLESRDSLESDEGNVMMFSDDWPPAGSGINEDFL